MLPAATCAASRERKGLGTFLVGRMFRMTVTIVVIVSAAFFATRLTGHPIDFIMPEGLDPQSRAMMIAYFGLDRPVFEQYLLFWRAIGEGEFGIGLLERRSVAAIFAERMGPSLRLLVLTIGVTVVIGVPLGVIAAIRRRSAAGTAILTAAFVGYTIPNFVLAIVMLLVFSYSLNMLPSSGNRTAAHHVMPVLALSAFFIAALVRYTRNAMLDVLSQDYMRTARAKGLSERTVVLRHGLRNALIPVVTVIGLQITTLVSGAVVIETVFAWNGIGDLLVGATLRRDYPVLQFGVLVVAAAVVAINAGIDLVYAMIDPRVRLSEA